MKPVVFAAVCMSPALSWADCYDDAARYQNVNPWVVRAIVAKESGFRPGIVTTNKNGSRDYGEGGINSVHLPELAKYGWTAQHLLDTCSNLQVVAWRLAKKIARHGNTWTAVGAYHSETPNLRDRYAADIRRILAHWAALYDVK
jgi:soluble lytic murein transglycosylase-like protein